MTQLILGCLFLIAYLSGFFKSLDIKDNDYFQIYIRKLERHASTKVETNVSSSCMCFYFLLV